MTGAPLTGKVLNWASILEDQTRDQVVMTSEMPFVYPHIALMPDAHLGKGCAVGAVIPTVGAIMPAAVNLLCSSALSPGSGVWLKT